MKIFLFSILLPMFSIFALDRADQSSIHEIVEHFADAWNHHGGRGFADYYAEDADFVNIFGMTFSGKQEIEDRHIKILQTFLKGSSFEVMDTKIHEVKPGTVIVLVYWKVQGVQTSRAKSLKETIRGVFTHAFVKKYGVWEIVASQNTLISD